MVKYIKSCNNSEEIAESIAELIITKCEILNWELVKEDIKSHYRTLKAFVYGERRDYHNYLLLVYNNHFNNKDKTTFQEFFEYLEGK